MPHSSVLIILDKERYFEKKKQQKNMCQNVCWREKRNGNRKHIVLKNKQMMELFVFNLYDS